MGKLDPLIEETLVATVAVALLGLVLSVILLVVFGMDLWPGILLGELIGLGMGVPMLALTSPRRRR